MLSLNNDNMLLRIVSQGAFQMMIGCGYCVKTIRDRRYLYFWHYENRQGRRAQLEEYIGPANEPRAREEVVRRVATYADRARLEMGRFVRLTRAEMAART